MIYVYIFIYIYIFTYIYLYIYLFICFAVVFQEELSHVMAQAFRPQSPRSLTVGTLVLSQACPCGICDGPRVTATDFSPGNFSLSSNIYAILVHDRCYVFVTTDSSVQ